MLAPERRADGQTNKTKPTVAFRNFAKTDYKRLMYVKLKDSLLIITPYGQNALAFANKLLIYVIN